MSNNLFISFGHNEDGTQEFLDLAQASNVLVTGAIGAGKSAFLHTLSHSIICKPAAWIKKRNFW